MSQKLIYGIIINLNSININYFKDLYIKKINEYEYLIGLDIYKKLKTDENNFNQIKIKSVDWYLFDNILNELFDSIDYKISKDFYLYTVD